MDGASSAPLPDGRAVALTVVRGPDTGAKYELTSARIVIGRKRGEVLLKDRETSSLHASIEYSPDGRFILKDLGSTNGTWLEGKKVTVAEIRPGQHVKVGANHLLFSLVDASSEATRQGHLDQPLDIPDVGDVSFPSPWSGGAAPSGAAASSGPLDVDLGMPDLGSMPTPVPPPVAPAPPPPMAMPPAPPAMPPPPPLAAMPPPPSPSAWPAPPPVASALPSPPQGPLAGPPAPGPSPPGDSPSRTSPGVAARALPDAPRAEVAPLPPLPPWPGTPTSERSTAVSPARPLPKNPEITEPPGALVLPSVPGAPVAAADAPASSPASAPASAPAPASTAPSAVPADSATPARGLPAGVERSVYGVYLVVERGRDRGRVFGINRQVTVLGRSGTEILINDPDISRRHAALDVQGEGKYILRDLNSTNGTLLNGVAVQSENISPNDKIRMGSTTIKLIVGDERLAAELARLEAEPGTLH